MSAVFTKTMPRDGYVPVQTGVDFGYHDRPRGVRRDIAEAAYRDYARRYGTSQSFDRLHERGGFSIAELLDHLASGVSQTEPGQ